MYDEDARLKKVRFGGSKKTIKVKVVNYGILMFALRWLFEEPL